MVHSAMSRVPVTDLAWFRTQDCEGFLFHALEVYKNTMETKKITETSVVNPKLPTYLVQDPYLDPTFQLILDPSGSGFHSVSCIIFLGRSIR